MARPLGPLSSIFFAYLAMLDKLSVQLLCPNAIPVFVFELRTREFHNFFFRELHNCKNS